jgi:hypothetical protein
VRGKKILVSMLLISIVASMAITSVGSIPDKPIVSMDPAVIFDSTMGIGTQFSVDITVDYVVQLWAYQLTLEFNPDVLHGVSVENGPFLESRGGSAIVIPGPGFDNVAGTLGLFAAALYPVRRFPTGGGVLATVTFEVVGDGCSTIVMGLETGLADRHGYWIVHNEDDPECFFDGYFDNLNPGPELWIRTKHGTFGGGAWPEWHVNLAGEEQILYSKVAQSGDTAAMVKVKFTVDWIVGAETTEYWSNEVAIPAVYIDPETDKKVYPLVTVATDPFVPGPEGLYTVTSSLYFKAGGMAEYIPYELAEEDLGGVGTARDTATKFKVAEQL